MMKLSRHWSLLVMSGIVLLAFVVRLIGVDTFSLWTDEGWSVFMSGDGSLSLALERVIDDRHPPFYFLLLAAWQNIAGDSLVVLRFLAVIAGSVATALTYRIGADWFSRRVGVYAALLVAIADLSIYYTQEVRHYSWLLLLTTTMIVLFLRYLARPTRRRWLAYMLCTWLLMLTHYFGVFVMLPQVVFGLVIWRADWSQKRQLVLVWIAAAILYIPWLILMIPSISMILRGVGGFPGSLATTPDGIYTSVNLLFDGHIALFGGAYLIALWAWWQQRPHPLPQSFVIAAGGGLLLFLFIFNLWKGVLSARMLVFLMPPIFIIVAYGIVQMSPVVRRVLLGVVVVLMLVIPRPVIQPRINAIGAGEALRGQVRPDDLVILELGWTDFTMQYQLQQMLAVPHDHVISTVWWQPETIVRQTDALLAAHPSVWVVQWLHAPVVLPHLQGRPDYYLAQRMTVPNSPEMQAITTDDSIQMVLFQQPEIQTPLAFYGEQVRLDDIFMPVTASTDEDVIVDLWWSLADTVESLQRDYSVGVYLLDDTDRIVSQADTTIASTPSSQWQPDTPYHQRLTLPAPPKGKYRVQVRVYHYAEPQAPLPTRDEISANMGMLTVR